MCPSPGKVRKNYPAPFVTSTCPPLTTSRDTAATINDGCYDTGRLPTFSPVPIRRSLCEEDGPRQRLCVKCCAGGAVGDGEGMYRPRRRGRRGFR